MPEHTSTLVADDGTSLFYREWPIEAPRASLHIVHGLGEHSGRYRHVAECLNAIGISVRAHDHRGHGRSEGARGALRTLPDLLTDLKLVFDDFTRQQAALPFLLGHSLGGLVAADFVTGGHGVVRGLVLSSPAFGIRMSAGQRMLLAVSSRLAPSLAIPNGLNVAAISHDPAVVAAYRADPLNHPTVTPRLVRFMLDAINHVQVHAHQCTAATLLLVAGSDRLVAPAACRDFFQRLPDGDRMLRWYDEAYHEIFNETPELRSRVLSDLSVWLDARIRN